MPDFLCPNFYDVYDMTTMVTWRDRTNKDRSAALCTSALLPRPPARIEVADDTLSADMAYRKACAGTALLWQADFQNARQLLAALTRRIEAGREKRSMSRPKKQKAAAERAAAQAAGADTSLPDPAEFHAYRQAQAARARILSMIWIPLTDDYTIDLRRAPEVQDALRQAFGEIRGEKVVSLRELLGAVGAAQWRERGVPVPLLGADALVHPYYGVFSPVRGEYLELVAKAPLAGPALAWDIGTGTGVLAAILAMRGVDQIVGTENSDVAIACAKENMARLKLSEKVRIVDADMFPPGKADLIVCNPPWLPARPTSVIEHAIYDPDSKMLRAFLNGLRERLNPGGEGWLIMSDLAVLLGLRSPEQLSVWIAQAGLVVAGRADKRPTHDKPTRVDDALHHARIAEVTTLWRLRSA